MTHSQRNRRRRRGRGGPRNKAFLAFMVLGIVVVRRRARRRRLHHPRRELRAAARVARRPSRSARTRACTPPTAQSLGFIQADELRLPVSGDQIPQVLKDATVAIEDERFYRHKGVDYEGVVRAAVKNVTSRRTVQGGSTITMQLVRNLYITPGADLRAQDPRGQARRGARERAQQGVDPRHVHRHRAVRHGGRPERDRRARRRADLLLQAACKDLTLREAALLAGLPQAPSTYSPTRAPEAAKARRNEVLRKMAELGMVTPERAERAMRARARPQRLLVLHAPARAVLLRLRQGRAVQASTAPRPCARAA